MSKYQEQSQLLDPLLEGLVQPLARLLGEYAQHPDSADLAAVRDVSQYLRHLASVRYAVGGVHPLFLEQQGTSTGCRLAPVSPVWGLLSGCKQAHLCSPLPCPQRLQDHPALLSARGGSL